MTIAKQRAFNLPIYISVGGVVLYPSKYEGWKGLASYNSLVCPTPRIEVMDSDIFGEEVKEIRRRIRPEDLIVFDKKGRTRRRNQNHVMGGSAQRHIEPFIQSGKVNWCHLVAYTMTDCGRAQTRRNLVCGTDAFNGHMTNIECAVKKFIYEYNRPLSIGVQATCIAGTDIAIRMRYSVVFSKNGESMTHSEYFDALTDVKTDVSDFLTIYDRMLAKFESHFGKISA